MRAQSQGNYIIHLVFSPVISVSSILPWCDISLVIQGRLWSTVKLNSICMLIVSILIKLSFLACNMYNKCMIRQTKYYS